MAVLEEYQLLSAQLASGGCSPAQEVEEARCALAAAAADRGRLEAQVGRLRQEQLESSSYPSPGAFVEARSGMLLVEHDLLEAARAEAAAAAEVEVLQAENKVYAETWERLEALLGSTFRGRYGSAIEASLEATERDLEGATAAIAITATAYRQAWAHLTKGVAALLEARTLLVQVAQSTPPATPLTDASFQSGQAVEAAKQLAAHAAALKPAQHLGDEQVTRLAGALDREALSIRSSLFARHQGIPVEQLVDRIGAQWAGADDLLALLGRTIAERISPTHKALEARLVEVSQLLHAERERIMIAGIVAAGGSLPDRLAPAPAAAPKRATSIAGLALSVRNIQLALHRGDDDEIEEQVAANARRASTTQYSLPSEAELGIDAHAIMMRSQHAQEEIDMALQKQQEEQARELRTRIEARVQQRRVARAASSAVEDGATGE